MRNTFLSAHGADSPSSKWAQGPLQRVSICPLLVYVLNAEGAGPTILPPSLNRCALLNVSEAKNLCGEAGDGCPGDASCTFSLHGAADGSASRGLLNLHSVSRLFPLKCKRDGGGGWPPHRHGPMTSHSIHPALRGQVCRWLRKRPWATPWPPSRDETREKRLKMCTYPFRAEARGWRRRASVPCPVSRGVSDSSPSECSISIAGARNRLRRTSSRR